MAVNAPGPMSARDVFILGAGFSKEISNEMPILRELSEAVAPRLPRSSETADVPFLSTNIEMAMTFLSQPQPWMTEPERLRNRALFLEITAAIADEIEERSASVRGRPCPVWLLRLVHWLHFQRSIVITLNYDTLLESAIIEIAIAGGDCYPKHLVPFRFAANEGSLSGGDRQPDSLELLKLHGATNWRYSGRDSFAGELIQWSGIGPWRKDWDIRGIDKVGGTSPLIIPPVTEKSGYFMHNSVQHLWRRASEALRTAKRVFCVGYSLPTTDLTMRFLLSDASVESPIDFYLVNLPSELEHFKNVLPRNIFRLNERFVGSQPIPSLVDALLTEEFFPDLPGSAVAPGSAQTAIRTTVAVGQTLPAAAGAGSLSIGRLCTNSVVLLIDDAKVSVVHPADIPVRVPWEALEELMAALQGASYQRLPVERCDEAIRNLCRRALGPWIAGLFEAAGIATIWCDRGDWMLSPAGSNLEEIARWRAAAHA